MSHFLHEQGQLACREPFHLLLPQGIVKARTYVTTDGKYVAESDVQTNADGTLTHTPSGQTVVADWEKMSKSKLNGVDPLALLDAHGVDVVRAAITSDVSPYSERNWDESGNHPLLFAKHHPQAFAACAV